MEGVEPPAPEPGEPRLPWPTGVAALGLAGAAAAPIRPDGGSFLNILEEAFRHGSALEGIMTLVGFGSPFLFGLAVSVGAFALRPAVAAGVLRPILAMMHAHLLLVAWVLFQKGAGVATGPLAAFAAASAGVFMTRSAAQQARGRRPTGVWMARWGATVIAGVAAWMRLQRSDGNALGWAVELALVSSVLMVLTLRGRPPAPTD